MRTPVLGYYTYPESILERAGALNVFDVHDKGGDDDNGRGGGADDDDDDGGGGGGGGRGPFRHDKSSSNMRLVQVTHTTHSNTYPISL